MSHVSTKFLRQTKTRGTVLLSVWLWLTFVCNIHPSITGDDPEHSNCALVFNWSCCRTPPPNDTDLARVRLLTCGACRDRLVEVMIQCSGSNLVEWNSIDEPEANVSVDRQYIKMIQPFPKDFAMVQ